LRAADQLRDLVPDAGHLLHMATHIDVLCGHYATTVASNSRAILADRKYLEREGPVNFYSLYRCHNYHFKIYGAMFLGQNAPALAAAEAMIATLPEDLLRVESPPMADWLDFPNGTLIFTEASPKKRASIHLVQGRASLAEFDRGGLDVLGATGAQFAERLRSERHTVKRALTDPTLFDGIGNAYSDEILHAAKLSPFRMTPSLTDDEVAALHRACKETLTRWIELLRIDVGDGFPDKVTAFRPEMAVHGKYDQPCPVCGTKVQRIVYADNEANYCPTCQTEGRLLADRSLSRLLKEDWPKTLDELENRKRNR
jgi:formamidopyrimidine-DNA glycosylase